MARSGHKENVSLYLEGPEALAVAVLKQALSDSRRADQFGEEARAFLGSADCHWWAELLGIDGDTITAILLNDRPPSRRAGRRPRGRVA